MSEENSDPQLEQVYQELSEVLQRHPDVGGFVALHNKDGGQFQPFFPRWTTATFRPKSKGGVALHFKIAVDSDSQDNRDTVSFLVGLRDTCLRASAIYENVVTAFAKHAGINLMTTAELGEPPGEDEVPSPST